MNHYNRANPFLYILDQSNDALNMEVDAVIKDLIVLLIIFSLWTASFVTDAIISKSFLFRDVIDVVTNIGLIGFTFYYVKRGIQENKSMSIDQIRFPSDQLTYHYYNNEKMFKETISISVYIGRLKGVRTITWVFMIVFGLQAICHSIHILLYFL